VYNLRNTLAHEDDHYVNGWHLFGNNLNEIYENKAHALEVREHQAITHQKNHESWLNTTQKFREDIQWYWDYRTRN